MKKQMDTEMQQVEKSIKWHEEGLEESSDVSVKFHEIEQHADAKILDKLSALGDQLEQMAWNIGWLTDKLYKNLIANKYEVDYLFVCYYVAVTKLKNQRSMNTVKKWALTARFFPKDIAKQYNYDILPMSHFAYAASFGNECAMDEKGKQIPIYQMVLNWSWFFYTGNPVSRHISVRELKLKFEGMRLPEKKIIKHDFDFVPDTGTAIESVQMSDIPVLSAVAEAGTDMVTSIVHGILQNFTMAISSYIPALVRAKPEAGQALAGVVHNLEQIASKLEE